MKKVFFIFIFFLVSAFQINAQNNKRAYFIGLNPAVTIEPFYQKGELDVNIFPIVFQKTLTNRIDFRFSAILNYGVRLTKDEISHYGGQICFPFFLVKKNDFNLPSKGFFVAPGIGITRNRIEKHTNIGFWLEPGYNLMISPKWSLTFGIQLGATHFNYDAGTKKWGNHFGIKIVIGRWF